MIDRDGLNRGLGVEALDKTQRDVANSATRAGHDIAYLARTRKNGRATIERRAVHHDGAEGLTRTGGLVAVDNLNLQVLATNLFPVGDLARIDIAELLSREVIDRVVVVHNDRDAVVCDNDRRQAKVLLIGVEATRRAGDIGGAGANSFDASR